MIERQELVETGFGHMGVGSHSLLCSAVLSPFPFLSHAPSFFFFSIFTLPHSIIIIIYQILAGLDPDSLCIFCEIEEKKKE